MNDILQKISSDQEGLIKSNQIVKQYSYFLKKFIFKN